MDVERRLRALGVTSDRVLLRYDFGGGACIVDYIGDPTPVTRDELRKVGFDWWARLEVEQPERAKRIMDRIEQRRAELATAQRRLELEQAAKKKRAQEDQ